MTITETAKGFEITFPYDREKVDAVKKIYGSWFKANTKTWVVPKHQEREINFLRQKFGVSKLLKAADVMPEQFEDIPELPDLDVTLDMPRKLFPFQERGVAYLRQNKRVIIGDQPGLGKTTQAIAACVSLGLKRILVICPSTLKLNWQKEWMEVAGRRSAILTESLKNTWHTYLNVGYIEIMITNYESLKKFFIRPGWKKDADVPLKLKDIPFREQVNLFEAVIIDESHKVKDGTTQQAKFVMGLTRGKQYVFELTGTPVVNRPKDLISQLHILGRLHEVVSHIPFPLDKYGRPSDASGYKRFLDRYCEGGRGSSNLKELNYRLHLCCFYRREKTEVLKDLPEKMRQVVLCDISNRHEYDKAQKDFAEYLKNFRGCSDSDIKRKLRAEMMVKIGILKQISARGKINDVQEFIQEVLDGGEKVVLFCHLKEIVYAIKDLFPGSVTITGDDSMDARDRSIRAFQTSPSTQLIICSLQAGGVGITLTASSRVVFIEFPWTYALCEQAEDRTHRIGQVNSVQCTYFLGENTIDRYCYDLIQDKKNIAQTITGDVGEVQEEIIDQLLNLFNQR